MKFKVGDKVRIKKTYYNFGFEDNQIVKIIAIYENPITYKIESETAMGFTNGDNLELVKEEQDIIEYKGKKYEEVKQHNFMVGSFMEELKDYDKVLFLKEHKEEILDEAEKEYLRNVIKPFRDRIIGIEKKECYMSDLDVESEIIFIIDKKQGHSLLPFRKNSMYVGMKLNESYTLEELGL